jgi:beta-lactamase regulating signal transducer with metallopeptidase domain
MIVTLAWNILWQGVLICAVALLALRCVPPGNAATRYAAWFAALLALVAVPVLTTTVHVAPILMSLTRSAGSSLGTFSLVPLGPLESATHWLTWPHALSSIRLSMALTALWCAGASFGLIRLAVSHARIARIRRGAVRIGHVDGVSILASAELSIPIATGVVAPSILLPNEFVQTLTAEDRRCTIEHELAHLRRGDVAGNAAQRILEALFFWNPWMYVVGRHLVAEREAACDDWAVQRLGEPNGYAFCLANLARRIVTARAPLLTPSAIGSRNALVARIERLVSERVHPESRLNYFVVGGIAVLFAVMALIFQSIVPASAQATAMNYTPMPVAVADAACKNPNAPPQALNAVAPELPQSPRLSKPVSAVVVVKVGIDGKAHGAAVYTSSGSARFDHAVVVAAEKSTYTPRLVNCNPETGVYLFKADFAPGP